MNRKTITVSVIGGIAAAIIIAVAALIWDAVTDGGLVSALGGATSDEMTAAERRLDAIEGEQDQPASGISECRICFREIEGSSQCQKSRNSCSGWSAKEGTGDWTQGFRDDTDDRRGGCEYQWRVECR